MKNHLRTEEEAEEHPMKIMTGFDAFLDGVRSAFGFSQSGALERCLVRRPGLHRRADRHQQQSVEDRMRANFERVGQHLDAAIGKVRDNHSVADENNLVR